MRSRLAMTLIEILVVIAIVAILAAIIFPAVAGVRRRAKETSCAARLYQLALAVQLYEQEHGKLPDDLSDMNEVAKGDVAHCPYPQTESSDYIFVLPQFMRGAEPPDPGTVMAYCVEHMRFAGNGPSLEVPLSGSVPFCRYPNSSGRTDARRLERWRRVGNAWEKIPETGTVPFYPEAWKFPGAPWPP